MKKIAIIGKTRTPIGNLNGQLKSLTEADLSALSMKDLFKDSSIEPGELSEVIIGNSKQTSIPSNCARYAMLEADFPEAVPAYTVQKHSASGLQALATAYWALKSGNGSLMLAGGTESMSQIPVEIQQGRFAFDEKTPLIFDPIKKQEEDAQPTSLYGVHTNADLAQIIAANYQLTQTELSDYVEKSKTNCEKSSGELQQIEIKQRKNTLTINQDEVVKDSSTVAPAADGAGNLLLTTTAEAHAKGWPVLAEIVSIKASASGPVSAGMVDTVAATQALTASGLTVEELDMIDITESSAAYVLAWQIELKKLGLSEAQITEKVNPIGGFLATGLPGGGAHPIQVCRMIDYLTVNHLKTGMLLTSAEGGQSMALIIKVEGN